MKWIENTPCGMVKAKHIIENKLIEEMQQNRKYQIANENKLSRVML